MHQQAKYLLVQPLCLNNKTSEKSPSTSCLPRIRPCYRQRAVDRVLWRSPWSLPLRWIWLPSQLTEANPFATTQRKERREEWQTDYTYTNNTIPHGEEGGGGANSNVPWAWVLFDILSTGPVLYITWTQPRILKKWISQPYNLVRSLQSKVALPAWQSFLANTGL
jgi:hypothetical protein